MDSRADSILTVENLVVRFPIRSGVLARTTGHVKAVDGIGFSLRRGETLALVGESGCGKSTTARAVLGLLKPSAGTIRLNLKHPERWRVQAVFQDPLASLNPRHTIREAITEAPLVHGLVDRGGADALARRLLARVGLDDSALARYPHEFSGGERQRICIARALALEPELLICDEAVSALDLSVRAQTLELLASLKDEYGLSVLFITHDLGVVQHIADTVLVMRAGRIEECGPCREVLANPRSPYTRELMASVPRVLPT